MQDIIVPLGLLILPLAASAEVSNIKPGEGEYTHTTRMEGIPHTVLLTRPGWPPPLAPLAHRAPAQTPKPSGGNRPSERTCIRRS